MSKSPRHDQPGDPNAPDPVQKAVQKGGAHAHDEDVIHVPKGSSRTRFLMTAILALLVLTTFTVSREVTDVLTGRNKALSAYLSWKKADGTLVEVKQSDFVLKKQSLAKLEGILSGGRTSRDRDDIHIARQLLLDDLAQEAGIEITDDELKDVILRSFGSGETYHRILQTYRMTPKEFEDAWRSVLRVGRYEQLLSQTAAVPDPALVVQGWKESHKEYSLDTVELATDAFSGEAKGALPQGDELKAWFEALPDPEKLTYRTPVEARTAAEFAWFQFEPRTKMEALLAKYPRPAEEKPDEIARTWYEVNKDLLYRKPDLAPGKAPAPEDYLPFEEVKERAQAEATAHAALLEWTNDLRARAERGEPAPFAEEAMAMGLAYRKEPMLHTRAEWKGAQMAFSGQAPLAAMFAPTAEPEKLLPDVFVDAKGLFVGRLLQKEDSRIPEYAEFEQKVREGWVSKKRGELAEAKLDALRAKFATQADPNDPASTIPVETDAEKFQAAAKELGLEAKTQDWFDAAAPMRAVPPDPFLIFQRQTAKTLGSVPGAVSKATLSPDKNQAWVARIVASREPDASKMTPQDYQVARQLAVYEGRNQLFEKTFGSDDFLKERYGMHLFTPTNEQQPPAAP